ncbi:alpha/beta hydrolase [Desulfobacterales bacterium HSG17]|nr:alpha/beta hydrolase [Desulfobacterales bacterium HSG17]
MSTEPGWLKMGGFRSGTNYLERKGGEETIVFIHGFTGNKDFWINFIRYIPEKYRVLCIDMIGHGSFPQDSSVTYKGELFTRGVESVIDRLNIEKFHLVGISLGGIVSKYYAADHSEKILSLCLFDSAGVGSSEPSDFQGALEKENYNPFSVKNHDEYERFIGYIYYEIPKAPWPVGPVFKRNYIKNNPFNMKIFNDIFQEQQFETTPAMEIAFEKLRMPILIIWGENDRLFHVSCVDTYKNYLPHVKTVVIPNCGHIPPIEKTAESAEHYVSFLSHL